MTIIVDVTGGAGVGVACHGADILQMRKCCDPAWLVIQCSPRFSCAGGETEKLSLLQGASPPHCAYRPRVQSVAPRTDAWQPARSNTQTPPRSGPVRLQLEIYARDSWPLNLRSFVACRPRTRSQRQQSREDRCLDGQ